MDGNRPLATAMAALLLLSSLMVLATVSADGNDNLYIERFNYDYANHTTPRAGHDHPLRVDWVNDGDTTASAVTIAIEWGSESVESDPMDLAPGSGFIYLDVNFDSDGEKDATAFVDYGGDFEESDETDNYETTTFQVEPEVGTADLSVDLDPNNVLQDVYQPDELIFVEWIVNNNGNVTAGYPNREITLALYVDPRGSDPTNQVAVRVFAVGDLMPEMGEGMFESFDMTTPSEEGRYVIALVVDIDDNNTDAGNLSDNSESFNFCIGGCSDPDLIVIGQGPSTLQLEPDMAIAGETSLVHYSIRNDGNADAPAGVVMHLEVMRCPGGDCDGQSWTKINETDPWRAPLQAQTDMEDQAILAMGWDVPSDGVGKWDLRVILDATDKAAEIYPDGEENNIILWSDTHGHELLNVRERRAELVVQGIEVVGQPFKDHPVDIHIFVAQDQNDGLGYRSASNVTVDLWIMDENFQELHIEDAGGAKDVGLEAPIGYAYSWTPTATGIYTMRAWVDYDDNILEWYETNNEMQDVSVEVKRKLSDLTVLDLEVEPRDNSGNVVMGVASTVSATIANLGIRDMTPAEASQMNVTFYTISPVHELIAEITPGTALAIGQNITVSTSFVFTVRDQYKIVVKVDERTKISEYGEDDYPSRTDAPNELSKTVFAESSIDAWINNVSVESGVAGKDHPITFDLGFENLPLEGDHFLYFTITVEHSNGAVGSYMEIPAGEGYHFAPGDDPVLPYGAYVDLNVNNPQTSISVSWIPEADKGRNYTITVIILAAINIDSSNDQGSAVADIEKLTTDLVVESLTVTDRGESGLRIDVLVLYPRGEQDSLNGVEVTLHVFDYADWSARGNSATPRDTFPVKSIEGALGRGDSRIVSFTWVRNVGDFVFVAEVDPNNEVRELDEDNNLYDSEVITIEALGSGGSSGEEDEGFLGLPSLSPLAPLALLGAVALLRRRL